MKRFLILILLLQSSSYAQVNLVSNWSFEDTVHCPFWEGQISFAKYWYSPTPNTPDYFNSCSDLYGVPIYASNFQYAKDGQAHAGIFLWAKYGENNHDYIQTRLMDSLQKNKQYCVGFWINLADFSRYAVDRVGGYLSKDPIDDTIGTYLHYTPQVQNDSGIFLIDHTGWTLITGTYLAQGGERYITIGNFSPDIFTDSLLVLPDPGAVNNAYYFIDAVFVYECDSTKIIEAGQDLTICKDSSIRIGTPELSGCHYKWTPMDGLDDDTLSSPNANPQQTTTYFVVMTDPFYQLTADSVTVYVDDNCLPEHVYIPSIFSPNGDGNNDEFYVRGQHIKEVHVSVYDRWGQVVFESLTLSVGWNGQYKHKDCPEGVYFFVAEVTFDSGESVVKKGNVTVVR